MRKNVWFLIALVMIIPAMLFTGSCAKQGVQTDPLTTPKPAVAKGSDTSAAEARPLQEDRLTVVAAAREAAGTEFLNNNIYFAFDSSLLSDEAQLILRNKADYLRTYPGVTVTIEGHCDERGSVDYNIALGQRRAQSVKNFLVDLGISTNRIKTISYGEDRPIAWGQNEASWAKNRRAQFAIN